MKLILINFNFKTLKYYSDSVLKAYSQTLDMIFVSLNMTRSTRTED